MQNRPRGRETHVTGQGSVHRRGDGLHSGPVGAGGRGGSGGSGRGSGFGGGGYSGGGGGRRSPLSIIIILIVLLLGGGGGAYSMLGGDGGSAPSGYSQPSYSFLTGSGSGSTGGSGYSTGGWLMKPNTGKLDTTVVPGARDKRTEIRGNGRDTVTIMVYMCGTDLESRSGMATSDLQEMASARLNDNVNVIVYTGGCNNWKNSAVSNRVNQIYEVQKGGLRCLVDNAGKGAMTDPNTLSDFITWCKRNYPANRNELILWDHGGGSLSGYGYDEKNQRSGSMTLSGINKALKTASVSFDFIGFDACLMATVETALMLEPYADYLIASEETEPGVGWYYTDWLSDLCADPSMSTLEVGREIADDFVDTCARKCAGQKTTLSVVDLAEAAATIPGALNEFALDTSSMIQKNEFKTVSNARYSTREFAQSSKIDQIDLVHFAGNLNSKAGDALADAVLGAVKYNQTASNMTNAYGLSIYFPYQKTSKVDTAVSTYKSIGMDSAYTRCIQQFASMEVGGQAASGGMAAGTPMSSLLGGLSSSGSAQVTGADALAQLFGAMMGGQMNVSGLSSSNSGFFTGRALDTDAMADFISMNQFDPANLYWQENRDGQQVISLDEDQWDLVQDLCLSVYYDDGECYVDLGLDNVYQFDEDGNLIGDTDGTWLAIDGQTVAYYYQSTIDDGDNYTITGYVPALLNGERVKLMLVFDNENPYGYISGAEIVYDEEVTETACKNLLQLEDGDTLEFLCDCYSYDGEYIDSYLLGEPLIVSGQPEISNVQLEKEFFMPMYRFTDIYQQTFWTEVF